MSDQSTNAVSAPSAHEIHALCERALRRLRVVERERHDVLLSSAVRSISRAAALSATRSEVK